MAESPSEALARYVCETPWASVRARAAKALKRGGLAALEEAASLVTEAEFRGRIPAADEFPDHVWTHLKHAHHPMGWLPPRRVPEEMDIGVWWYGPDGSVGASGLPSDPGTPIPDGLPVAVDLRTGPDEDAAAPFKSICEHSNGRYAGASFEFDALTGISSGVIDSISAAFEPLRSLKRRTVSTAHFVSFKTCRHELAIISMLGGAYTHEPGAARGRLGAWRAIRWLVTPRLQTPFDELYLMAQHAEWIRFNTDDYSWFYHVAWDGCVACRAGSRVSILAWTDTD